MIDEVTQSLLEITHAQHNVVLEGHTDDVPVGLSVFPSSWELSSARATSIVRRMLEKGIQTGTSPLQPSRTRDPWCPT
jgi:chemotaxis protein MotB